MCARVLFFFSVMLNAISPRSRVATLAFHERLPTTGDGSYDLPRSIALLSSVGVWFAAAFGGERRGVVLFGG